MKTHPTAVTLALVFLLAGCAAPPPQRYEPLQYPRSPAPEGLIQGLSNRPTQTTVSELPSPPAAAATPARTADAARTPTPRDSEEVTMALEQTPLPMFIQIVYGNVLKRPYSMDQAVTARTDLVTFKTSQPITAARMEELTARLLRSYGLAVHDYDGLVRIVPENAAPGMLPQLRRGKALPQTPEPQRPVFHHVELDAVRSGEVNQWLKQMLGSRVTLQEDASRNGFLLSGTHADVRAALDLIETLDQPRMRGRVARRISPAFAGATEFATRLMDVLAAQGYSVANSATTANAAILVIPIPAIGSVIVFTSNDTLMSHALRWARELDRPPAGQGQNALFTYAVRYADAQQLADTLGEILGGGSGAAPAPAPAAPGQTAAAAPRSSGGGRIVVNNATNTLIIRGTTAEEYQQIMTLLRELDRPTKTALIEVVVAELSRQASRSLGINWTYARAGGLPGSNIVRSITNGENAGLNISFINDPRTLVATLNALADRNEVRILSSPKVMARNGEAASISVGDDVPIITSQQSTGTVSGGIFGGTQTGILQQVQYRSTGMLLRVRPVINSGNRLDLDVSQEVSTPRRTETGVSASPTISTRRVETKLSLRDGSTVLLGGLIRNESSNGDAGVPFLKDIPVVGSLFKTQSTGDNQTELLIMITPYVINDDYEAEAISDAMQNTFGDWARDLKPARLPPRSEETSPSAAPPAMPSDVPSPRAPDMPIPAGPSPAPTPATPPGSAPARPVDDGVTMSRPGGAAPANAAPANAAPANAAPAAAAPAASEPPKSSTPPPADAPIKGGAVVDDEQMKQEILKRLQKR